MNNSQEEEKEPKELYRNLYLRLQSEMKEDIEDIVARIFHEEIPHTNSLNLLILHDLIRHIRKLLIKQVEDNKVEKLNLNIILNDIIEFVNNKKENSPYIPIMKILEEKI